MKYWALRQGCTSKVDGKWHSPKNMNEPGGFEHNMLHGLLSAIEEDYLAYPGWGEGHFIEENGVFRCVASNWDSSG